MFPASYNVSKWTSTTSPLSLRYAASPSVTENLELDLLSNGIGFVRSGVEQSSERTTVRLGWGPSVEMT